jgi:hypothetical protein
MVGMIADNAPNHTKDGWLYCLLIRVKTILIVNFPELSLFCNELENVFVVSNI